MALLYYILCKPRGFMTIEFQKKKKKRLIRMDIIKAEFKDSSERWDMILILKNKLN